MADGRGSNHIRLYCAYDVWMKHKNIFGRGLIVVPSRESLDEKFALHLLEIHSSCKLCDVPPCAPVAIAGCAAEAIPGNGLPPIESPDPVDLQGKRVNDLNTMGKFKKGTYEEPQLTEKLDCQTDCLPGRGENMQDDYREHSEAEEIAGEQQTREKHDYKTLSIKEEDLDDYYGEGDKPKETLTELLPAGDVEYDANFAKEDGLEDEWIEDDKSEGYKLADEEGLPYHVHIKEEVSDDDYLENDYQGAGCREGVGEGDGTRNVQMVAYSSSKQDGSSSKEDCNEITKSSPQITRTLKDGSPCNESETNLTVSEETVSSRSDMSLSKGSVSSTNRQNQDDHLQVLCVEEVDTIDQDLHHEHGQLNSPGEIDCGEDIQEYSLCNTGSSPQKHISTYTREKRFACPECHKRFTQKRSLMRHMEVHIPVKPHKCSLCGKEFSSEGRLLAHIRGHTVGRSFECPYCNKGFTDNCGLTRHIRTHTGEKPFKCSLCDKLFSVKGNLVQHLRTHAGEKPFTCVICEKRFLHQSWLSRHITRTHSGTRIKPFQCCVCDKSFSENSDLTRHMKTHTRKK